LIQRIGNSRMTLTGSQSGDECLLRCKEVTNEAVLFDTAKVGVCRSSGWGGGVSQRLTGEKKGPALPHTASPSSFPFVLGPLVCFLSELNWNYEPYRHSVGLLVRGISPVVRGRYLHAEQHKHSRNADRHPCLEWDSSP
jgi:hypothetical protein